VCTIREGVGEVGWMMDAEVLDLAFWVIDTSVSVCLSPVKVWIRDTLSAKRIFQAVEIH
jgi:hypothetical protein